MLYRDGKREGHCFPLPLREAGGESAVKGIEFVSDS